MKKLLIILVSLVSIKYTCQLYTAKVIDSTNKPISFIKFKYKNQTYNTDSLGLISGNIKIGDTITFNDFNYNKKAHIIKNFTEKIYLTEKYKVIQEVKILKENISNNLEIKRTKKAIFLSLRHDIDNAFLVKNNTKLVFNNIIVPIKYFSDKKYNYNQNSRFSIQIFGNENGLPKDPLTNIIYFTSSKNLKYININLKEKQVIPKNDFFIVLKAYEKNSEIKDKSSYKFNPYFLCNVDGESGSYLQYRQKDGNWKIITEKEMNNMILNLNIKFSLK